MVQQTSHSQLAAMLTWYREMGVTVAVDAEPIDWRSRGDRAPGADYVRPIRSAGAQRRPIPATRTAPAANRSGPSTVPTTLVADRLTTVPPPAPLPHQSLMPQRSPPVRSFAAKPGVISEPTGLPRVEATSLDELQAELTAFDGCGLKATAKNLCVYRGAPKARLMIIGEAPGREEDMAGKPFVGPAGQLLDRMLATIGQTEADVHITNVVYWRPPGNRTPSPQEAIACAPFLARQIELVAPEVILILGGAAAQQLLGAEGGIMRVRGKWREIVSEGRMIPAMATLHPAYVLRVPASKRQVWRDLLAIRAKL